MRYLLLALALASIYLTASHFMFDQSGIYGPTLKILLRSYHALASYIDSTFEPPLDLENYDDDDGDEGDADGGDDEIGVGDVKPLSQIICNTWPVLKDLMFTMLTDVKRLTEDIIQNAEDVITSHETFVFDTRMQVHTFQDRVQAAEKEFEDMPGPAREVLHAVYHQLDNMYDELYNVTKRVVLDMGYVNHEVAVAIKTHTYQVVHRVRKRAKRLGIHFTPDMVECVCTAVIEADQLYNRQYPNLQMCMDEYDDLTRDLFNDTRYNFHYMSNFAQRDIANTLKTGSIVHGMMYFPVKVCIFPSFSPSLRLSVCLLN